MEKRESLPVNVRLRDVTFQLQGEMLKGGPGTFAFAERGVAHTFANPTEREARLLVLGAPAGSETYFEEMAADYARGHWPSSARPDPADAIAVGPRISASGPS